MAGNVINNRITSLLSIMGREGIDYYIVYTSDPHGSEYIDDYYKDRQFMTGFTGSAGILVVSKSEAALFVDGRYHIQAENETKGADITLYKLGMPGVPEYFEYISDRVKDYETVGFNGRVCSQFQFEKLKDHIENNSSAKNISYKYDKDLIDEIWTDRPKQHNNPVFMLSKEASGKESSEKIRELREKVKEKNADGCFISALDDICYLFNLRGSDILYGSVAYLFAYITKESAGLFLKSDTYDYNTKANMLLGGINVLDYYKVDDELCKLKENKILLDKSSVSAYLYQILSAENELINVENYKLIPKHIKNETEMMNARKYGIIDSIAVVYFIKEIKERVRSGKLMNEYEAAKLLDSIRSKNKDFFSLSFGTIAAYKENAAIAHYSPDENNSKMLAAKGFLLVDSGAHYIGATTDITRTIRLGYITDEERDSFTYVLKGNLALMDAVFLKGTRCENLDILAREPIWKLKQDYRHGTGHGIGSFLNVHEGPYRIHYKIKDDDIQPEIEEGMIISDEPGLYVDGRFGIRHETQLLCVKSGSNEYGDFLEFEPLSLVPFDLEAINFELLTDEEIKILNAYHKRVYEKLYKYVDDDMKKWLKNATNEVDCK